MHDECGPIPELRACLPLFGSWLFALARALRIMRLVAVPTPSEMQSGCRGFGTGQPHSHTTPKLRNNSGRPVIDATLCSRISVAYVLSCSGFPLLETSELLANELEDPLVQSDARLRLRCLVVKGDVDLDMDTGLAKRDWTEARSLAENLGEAGWVNRAQGELAIVSFLSGNHEAAALSILAAIVKVRQIRQSSAVVRYESLVGDGLVQWKQYDKALKYFDGALDIAKSEPDIQHLLLLYSER